MAYNDGRMRQPRLWIEIAVVVIVAIAAFFAGRSLSLPASPDPGIQASSDPMTSSPTREDVPAGTSIPSPTSTDLPPGVAQPEDMKLSGGNSSPYLRRFKVDVKDGEVIPNNIVVRAGDILTVVFESGDKAYEFVQPDYGLAWRVPEG